MKIVKLATLVFGVLIASVGQSFCQTNLEFTGINATAEGAIHFAWSSISNEVYEVDEADALTDTDTGGITWNKLYDDYPSQGTNTFIGDYGNYLSNPGILHPRNMPMRFYRIVDLGASPGEVPFVSITSITNGATVSGQIIVSVVATSSLPVINTTLYVDGQKMDPSADGSNYVINTCEWLNGPHTLFVTAKAQSALAGPGGAYPIDIGRGVSPFVNVNFNNLISSIAFSEPFFQPSLGQTQEVTASFAANVDWTLQVIDDSSNVVRTATGSGTSLVFDWDGTGDGGANIPDGVYFFTIDAQTNGEAFSMMSMSRSSVTLLSDDEPMQLWALPQGSSDAPVPLALYPPGFDTNGFDIFEASQSQVRALIQPTFAPRTTSRFAGGGFTADDSSGGSGGSTDSSQKTVAPTRPPTSPVKNSSGDIGVAYFDHSMTNVYSNPRNGLPLPGNGAKVKIENTYGTYEFDPIVEAGYCANDFVAESRKRGWWGPNSFNLSGSTLHVNDLRSATLGGNEIFGRVNLGLFIDHGNYGTSTDYNTDANECLDTYFASDNPADGSAPWLRLSELGTGGNLRWMGIIACNILRNQNYNSMLNQGALPIKSNLHLFCSATTFSACGDVGGLWAYRMNRSVFLGGAETVKQAWYDAGQQQYSPAGAMTGWSYGTIVFRVVGQDNCMDDKLNNYQSTTSGTLTEDHQQVYP